MKPLFIISKKKLLEQHGIVKDHCDLVSYSLKTNTSLGPLLEKETSCMFSVHFANELKHLSDMKRVIFLAQAWDYDQIDHLIAKGISSFIVDNENDLDELISFMKVHDVKLDLMLRLHLKENTIRTERYFVFGMLADVVARRIAEIRADDSINSKIGQLGIHFHRKTQNLGEWNLLGDFSEAIGENTLKLINAVNIGGGLPASYADTQTLPLDPIFKKIDEFRKFLSSHNVKLVIEPGRFLAAPSVKLVTTILAVHKNVLIVNASVYNSDPDALIVPVKLRIEGELEKGEGNPYIIKGCTPCSLDLFRYKVYLKNPQKGERLIFLNAGAYNFWSNFCDLEEIQTILED